jgi:hypothetical protein
MWHPGKARAILVASCLLLAAPVLAPAAPLPGCTDTGKPGAPVCEAPVPEWTLPDPPAATDFEWDASPTASMGARSESTTDDSPGVVWFIGLVLVSGGLIRYFSSDAWVDYVRHLYLDY